MGWVGSETASEISSRTGAEAVVLCKCSSITLGVACERGDVLYKRRLAAAGGAFQQDGAAQAQPYIEEASPLPT